MAEEAVVKEDGVDSGKVAERGDSLAEFDELLIEMGRLNESGRLPGRVRKLLLGWAMETELKTSVEAGAERVTRSLPRFVDLCVAWALREPARPVGGAESVHSAAMYA